MNEYAFIVKNDEGTWDIWMVLNDIPIPERKARVDNAIESGFPIVGKEVTDYGISVKSGSVWNGTEWTGGDFTPRKSDTQVGLFAYICDNTVILMHSVPLDTPSYNLHKAVFESDNSLIRVPEGQDAEPGDLWDGEKVVKRV